MVQELEEENKSCDVPDRLIDKHNPFLSSSDSLRKTNIEKEENREKSLGNEDVSLRRYPTGYTKFRLSSLTP
jgi:hypothetical protein